MEDLKEIQKTRKRVEQTIEAYWNFNECNWNNTYEKRLRLIADYQEARSKYHALIGNITLSEIAEKEYRDVDHKSKIR